MELEAEVARLRTELATTKAEAREALAITHRQYRRDLVPVSQKLVPLRNGRRSSHGTGGSR